MNVYYKPSSELYHHGVKGMKWGRRRFQAKNGRLTSAGKKRYSNSDKSEKVFNALKKGANTALDKADRDNFFNSDSIFSEKSMKRQAKIDAARTVINDLDYNTLKDPKRRKKLVDTGKGVLNDYLDDMDSASFFNDDWDTRMSKREKTDFVRDLIND